MMNYLITGTVNRYTALDEYLTTTAMDSSIETLIAAQRRLTQVYKLTDDNYDLDKFFKGCGTKYIIPCFTMGGPGSTFPGAYDCATELIDEFSEQYFGNKIDFTRTLTGTFSHHKAEEQYGDK